MGEERPLRVEYINYEAPTILDTEALARALQAGTCGVCITGGSGAAEQLTQEEPRAQSSE